MESKVVIFFFSKAQVSVTIMYMLLGVLVDVIGAVASTEKQKIEITYIVGDLEANPSEYVVGLFLEGAWKIHLQKGQHKKRDNLLALFFEIR